jgi:hypothetical protein
MGFWLEELVYMQSPSVSGIAAEEWRISICLFELTAPFILTKMKQNDCSALCALQYPRQNVGSKGSVPR